MSSLPVDPSSTSTSSITYKYESGGADSQLLVATLENASDPDIADSQSRCSSLYTGYGGTKPIPDTNYLIWRPIKL
jgi:hypothetical protein